MKRGALNEFCNVTSRGIKSAGNILHEIAWQKSRANRNGDTIMISPLKSSTEAMHGMFESDGHAVDRFLEQKKAEREPSVKPFGELPDIFVNPLVVDDFNMYNREELNER